MAKKVSSDGLNYSTYLEKTPDHWMPTKRTKQRTCLHCRKDFESYHAGNRICSHCETLNSFQNSRSGYDTTGFLSK